MSRRARAVAFLLAALACAVLSAALAGGYGDRVAERFGDLRPVVVASAELPARRPLAPSALASRVEVRRVPARFVPPDALASPAEAAGRAPRTAIPAGSYLLRSQLAESRPHRGRRGALPRGLTPVEIAVSGAGALVAAGGRPEGIRVDVVVTTEPGPGGQGRTRVVAGRVELLALNRAGSSGEGLAGGSAGYEATLAVTRPQALRLIQAESFARQVRLIARSSQ